MESCGPERRHAGCLGVAERDILTPASWIRLITFVYFNYLSEAVCESIRPPPPTDVRLARCCRHRNICWCLRVIGEKLACNYCLNDVLNCTHSTVKLSFFQGTSDWVLLENELHFHKITQKNNLSIKPKKNRYECCWANTTPGSSNTDFFFFFGGGGL